MSYNTELKQQSNMEKVWKCPSNGRDNATQCLRYSLIYHHASPSIIQDGPK